MCGPIGTRVLPGSFSSQAWPDTPPLWLPVFDFSTVLVPYQSDPYSLLFCLAVSSVLGRFRWSSDGKECSKSSKDSWNPAVTKKWRNLSWDFTPSPARRSKDPRSTCAAIRKLGYEWFIYCGYVCVFFSAMSLKSTLCISVSC